MKHLITCLALGIACAAGAQGKTIHEYPWNPDWNNDNYVGSSDLTGFLAAYGSEFGNPPEPCDYDGSSFENLMFGINDGSISRDSIFIEFELVDVSTFYVPGCPDPMTDTVVFVNSGILTDFENENPNGAGQLWRIQTGNDAYGNTLRFSFWWGGPSQDPPLYTMGILCQELRDSGLEADGFFGSYTTNVQSPLPFPSSTVFNESGISSEDWTSWATYANYLHILPYWHYAE